MAQVLTNENMVDFIQTRSVPEFKPPEAPKEEAKVEPSDKPDEKPADQARDETGKFAKKDSPKQEEKPAEVKADKSADDDDYSQASEEVRKKIDKIIAKKHRAMKEAEEFGRDEARRALAAEARAAELQKQIDALKAPQKSDGPDTAEGDEPKPEDFKTVGEYTRALVKYEARKEKEAKEAESSERAVKDAQTKAQERMLKQIEEVRKEHEDFAEVMQSVKWKAPQHVATFILESENGARMAYHLAKHEEDYHRIAALTPVRAIAELGKLEDKLFGKADSRKEEAPERSVSKAPPPIQPLEAKSTPVVKDPKDMSFAELRAYRESQKRDGKWRAF